MNELKVLILDDESRITEKLKYHLEKRNFIVTTANTPKEGLQNGDPESREYFPACLTYINLNLTVTMALL